MKDDIIFLYSRIKWLGKVGTPGRDVFVINDDGNMTFTRYLIGEDYPYQIDHYKLNTKSLKNVKKILSKYDSKIKRLPSKMIMRKTGDIYDIYVNDERVHGIAMLDESDNVITKFFQCFLKQIILIVGVDFLSRNEEKQL